MKNTMCSEHGLELLLSLLGCLGILGLGFGQGAKPNVGLKKADQAKPQRIRIEVVRAVGAYDRTNHVIDLHLKLRVFPASPASGISIYNDWQAIEALPVEPYVEWFPASQTAGNSLRDGKAIRIEEEGTLVEWVLPCWAGMSPENIHKPITARIRYRDGKTESSTVVAAVRLIEEGG